MTPSVADVDQLPCKVVLASTIARTLLNEVQAGVTQTTTQPRLVGFLANNDPPAQMYADWTSKACAENGFAFDLRTVTRDSIEEHLLEANNDTAVHGIIVYYPIFRNRQDQYLQNIVSPQKDVEGLSHQFVFNLYQNIRFLDDAQTQKSILPCTPLAIVKILEFLGVYNSVLSYGNRLFGRTISVINRSEVVGRPLAALLANDGACIYSVDVNSVQKFTRGSGIRKRRHDVEDIPEMTLESVLQLSDVVISGVPSETFKVPLQHIREGAVCINFSSEKNFAPEIKEQASIYVPAIGKVTIATLLRNLLVSDCRQEDL